MCGRFALVTEKHILEMLFDLELRGELEPRFNIAPSEEILALRQGADGRREVCRLKWGLVPYWSKDRLMGNKLINARSESAAQKPAFRDAFRRRRVLIPVSCFYEWKKTERGKQPYCIRMKGGSPFALGALWESWPKESPPLQSCAILTASANELVTPIHDRMPVIIPPESYGLWLNRDTSISDLQALLSPYAAGMMEAVPLPADIFKSGAFSNYI
jgi:putative SOS response-associated peptidase YedK